MFYHSSCQKFHLELLKKGCASFISFAKVKKEIADKGILTVVREINDVDALVYF